MLLYAISYKLSYKKQELVTLHKNNLLEAHGSAYNAVRATKNKENGKIGALELGTVGKKIANDKLARKLWEQETKVAWSECSLERKVQRTTVPTCGTFTPWNFCSSYWAQRVGDTSKVGKVLCTFF